MRSPAYDGAFAPGAFSASDGRSAGGKLVLFLARGGLRSLSRPGARGSSGEFLGYTHRDLFWRDVLELVHEKDLPGMEDEISCVVGRPGSARLVLARVRDAAGEWRQVEAVIRNVIEAPGDVGFVVAEVREAFTPSPVLDGRGAPRNPFTGT